MTLVRAAIDVWPHSCAPARAAATARSTTSGVAIGTRATTRPVADSVTSVWRSAGGGVGRAADPVGQGRGIGHDVHHA